MGPGKKQRKQTRPQFLGSRKFLRAARFTFLRKWVPYSTPQEREKRKGLGPKNWGPPPAKKTCHVDSLGGREELFFGPQARGWAPGKVFEDCGSRAGKTPPGRLNEDGQGRGGWGVMPGWAPRRGLCPPKGGPGPWARGKETGKRKNRFFLSVKRLFGQGEPEGIFLTFPGPWNLSPGVFPVFWPGTRFGGRFRVGGPWSVPPTYPDGKNFPSKEGTRGAPSNPGFSGDQGGFPKIPSLPPEPNFLFQ